MDESVSQSLCRVIDTTIPPPQESSLIRSMEELETMLRSYVARAPRILEVHLPNGMYMRVGIGGDLGGVIACPVLTFPPGQRPAWTAMAHRLYTKVSPEYLTENVPYQFCLACLMPTEEVLAIVLDFVRLGDLPNTHVWGPPGGEYRWEETRREWEERLRKENGIEFSF